MRQDADCGSDHNPVIARIKVKLQKNGQANNKGQTSSKWNIDLLKDPNVKVQFEELSEDNTTKIGDINDTDTLWSEIKSCITNTAELMGVDPQKKVGAPDRGR